MSGKLTWRSSEKKSNQWNSRFAGKEAGCIIGVGYITIRFNKKTYKAHRVAWYLKTGEIPDTDIDHKDQIKSNNSWTNLRKATNAQNQMNTSARKNSITGIKGVGYRKDVNKWTARIGFEDKVIWLGFHDTLEGAKCAYKEKAIELYGDFASF